MRFIGRLLWLLIIVFTVIISMAFATSNDSTTTLYLWPFTAGLTMPVWLSVLGALGIGILAGGFIAWLSSLAIRTRSWRLHHKLKKAEKRANDVEIKLAEAENNPAPVLPSNQH
jgi:uncharacterized membrane protein YciS (DUF1049 family)